MKAAAIGLQGVTVRFSAEAPAVLQALDLNVRPGEFLSLLGPSGCGKSTVLRVMAGLQAIDAGSLQARTQCPAFVFQDAALMPWACLEDNVSLPLRLAGVRREAVARRVEAVLERVGLQGRQKALPHELSGGMRMRASIARALVMEPDLLLMDEPFAALDDLTRRRLQDDLMHWWQAAGFTVCFVTHQVAEAVFMSSRVAVFEPTGGRIGQIFEIDQPFPRDEAFRSSAPFIRICSEIGRAMAGLELDQGVGRASHASAGTPHPQGQA